MDLESVYVVKEFERKKQREIIIIGNDFVDAYFFNEKKMCNIPIIALRIIFKTINILSTEQFRPEDRPLQLKLFEDEFHTKINSYAKIRIRNSEIIGKGSIDQFKSAMEFLTTFKMKWYESYNSKGEEVSSYGGLISLPTYSKRGNTVFLISSYWIEKLIIISNYNHFLYSIVTNCSNNKVVIFAIWLEKIPTAGTTILFETFNEKFNLNYKSSNEFCQKFLKLIRINLNKFNLKSFNYSYESNRITIVPYLTKNLKEIDISEETSLKLLLNQRVHYFKKRYKLEEIDFKLLKSIYSRNLNDRKLIENSYEIFVNENRKKKIKSTDFSGREFLKELQKIIIDIYRKTETGIRFPNGFPRISI